MQDTQSENCGVEVEESQLESDAHSSDGFTNETSMVYNRKSADIQSILSQSVSAPTQALASSSRTSSTPAPKSTTAQNFQHKSNIQEMKKYKRKKK